MLSWLLVYDMIYLTAIG